MGEKAAATVLATVERGLRISIVLGCLVLKHAPTGASPAVGEAAAATVLATVERGLGISIASGCLVLKHASTGASPVVGQSRRRHRARHGGAKFKNKQSRRRDSGS